MWRIRVLDFGARTHSRANAGDESGALRWVGLGAAGLLRGVWLGRGLGCLVDLFTRSKAVVPGSCGKGGLRVPNALYQGRFRGNILNARIAP